MMWNPLKAWRAYQERRREELELKAERDAQLKLFVLDVVFEQADQAKRRRLHAQAECSGWW